MRGSERKGVWPAHFSDASAAYALQSKILYTPVPGRGSVASPHSGGLQNVMSQRHGSEKARLVCSEFSQRKRHAGVLREIQHTGSWVTEHTFVHGLSSQMSRNYQL